MYFVGERINGMFKDIAFAISTRDENIIKEIVLKQTNVIVDALDINVGPLAQNPVYDMEWLVKTVRKFTDLPLVIDTTKFEVMKVGIELAGYGKGIINSISPTFSNISLYLDLAKKYSSKIIVLTMTKQGLPKTSLERVEVAAESLTMLQENGFSPEDIFIDPIILPLNVAQDQITEVLETISQVKMLSEPKCKTILGLSNVSQKCPHRSLINRTFLTMALEKGLDAAILDVNDTELVNTIIVSELLLNKQIYCDNFLESYKKKYC
jgi:5-methyltetrahydrofolate corrinoid/iron sulfur protein methyltransferase